MNKSNENKEAFFLLCVNFLSVFQLRRIKRWHAPRKHLSVNKTRGMFLGL